MKRFLSKLFAASISCSLALSSHAQEQPAPATQPPQFSTILYGAAYYNEYNPYERLDKDVA